MFYLISFSTAAVLASATELALYGIADFDVSKLYSTDFYEDGYYGCAVACWGQTVLIGAYATNEFGNDIHEELGSVFVYENHNQYSTRLDVPNNVADSYFGYSVAMSGNAVVVGAPGASMNDCNECGAAYVYRRNNDMTWNLEATIVTGDFIEHHYLGYSVAIYNSRVVVGAPGNRDEGAAYVYERQGSFWRFRSKLSKMENNFVNDNAGNEDRFGSAVALYGNNAIVGAYGDNYNTGIVYAYNIGGQTQNILSQYASLIASDSAVGICFGYSVAMYENLVVVGAYNANSKWAGSGAVYLYDISSISFSSGELVKLTANDAVSGDFFGFSVAIYNNFIIVGAPGEERDDGPNRRLQSRRLHTGMLQQGGPQQGGPQQGGAAGCGYKNQNLCDKSKYLFRTNRVGAAYVFERSGNVWSQSMKLQSSMFEYEDRFGVAVAVYDAEFVVGADMADGTAQDTEDTGAAYVFFPKKGLPSEQQSQRFYSNTSNMKEALSIFLFPIIAITLISGFFIWLCFCKGNSKDDNLSGTSSGRGFMSHHGLLPYTSAHGDRSNVELSSSRHNNNKAASFVRAARR